MFMKGAMEYRVYAYRVHNKADTLYIDLTKVAPGTARCDESADYVPSPGEPVTDEMLEAIQSYLSYSLHRYVNGDDVEPFAQDPKLTGYIKKAFPKLG